MRILRYVYIATVRIHIKEAAGHPPWAIPIVRMIPWGSGITNVLPQALLGYFYMFDCSDKFVHISVGVNFYFLF